MKILLSTIATAAALAIATPSSAAFMPTGPQTNVATSTVAGWGWAVCWTGSYNDGGTTIASMLAGCEGQNLMMAARQVGSDSYTVLAAADRADVTFATGANNTVGHEANGVNWYFDNDYSWGFAEAGGNLFKNSCDYGDGNIGYTPDPMRLCWHTSGGEIVPGWRAGATGSAYNGWERFLLVQTAVEEDVPEPAMLGLFGLGALGLGLARRRKA